MLGRDQAASWGKPGTNITFINNSYKTGYKLMIFRLINTACVMRIVAYM